MPAFGQDGIKNLNQSKEKDVWEIVNTEGKVLMICDCESQAISHKQSLFQKYGKEVTIRQGKLKCL